MWLHDQYENHTHFFYITTRRDLTATEIVEQANKRCNHDEELVPIKGQLVFLPPDPAVDFLSVGGGSDVTYMFPRSGEILLGGSYQQGDWSPHPEAEVTERIIDDHRALFSSFG